MSAQPGTARAALAVRDFRVVWTGAFASNTGTWMQTVVLGAYVYAETASPLLVSVATFAQLGPLLLLSMLGGLLADTVDRRRLLITAQAEQLVMTALLAFLASRDDPWLPGILLCVLAIGTGNALQAPAWATAVPELVGRENLAGAVSLNTAQMNGSRVIGPAIAGLLFPVIGAAGVFAVNAFTFVPVLVSLLRVRLPPVPEREGRRRLADGVRIARRDPFVARILTVLALFSLLSLPFVYQLPTIAATNLGMDVEALPYGLLFATFGLGAVSGALSVGTVFAGKDGPTLVRRGLAGHGVFLLLLAVASSPALAYPILLLLGFCYFLAITALNTLLQSHLDASVKGQVMALWLMCFGGTVPLGLLLAGPIAEVTSIRVVLAYGVVAALGLSVYARGLSSDRRKAVDT
ncbi:MAG: arabinose efflux permease family protein [Frankiales bacterium]|jgi:MFS family permease|nr:arabinose efflux permease family protein [Frankiales bacterium]